MITNTTSQGLNGLPHFKSSRAAMELKEPIYQNLFTVNIKLPDKIGATDEDTKLMLEGIQKVAGLNNENFKEFVEARKVEVFEVIWRSLRI